MGNWLVVVISLGAAAAFALSTSLKYRSARTTPDAQDLAPRSIGRFIRATLSHPLWLGGIAADALGLGLQVIALHIGALAVVQPLLISALLFALPLNRRISGRRASGRELGWATLVALALAGFLALAGTANTTGASNETPDHSDALTAAAIGIVLAAVCVSLARRQRGGRSAALLGIAVGTVYASTAALIKGVTDLALRGPLVLLSSWQPYTLVVVGAAGLVLNQLAFQAGPLTASLPAIATVDPLFSVAIGVWVYDEQIRHTLPAGVGLALILLLLGAAVIRLTSLEKPAEPGADLPRPAAIGTAGS